MPGVPTSRACDACRQQKKKCDELKPKCLRCSRLCILCVDNGVRRFKFQEANAASKARKHSIESVDIIAAKPPAHKAEESHPRVTNTKVKRVGLTKDRNGCETCRIRNVRCDETRPVCKRCVTTGYNCDGYIATPPPAFAFSKSQKSPIHAIQVLANPISPLPGKSPEELRSFRFFVDVTAPSLGGVFSSTFWETEIPRACYLDNAIWHAIVGLASAHESSVSAISSNTSSPTRDNLYTLRHYNSAVRDLLSSYSPDGCWRVLTLSILFTSICCMEKNHADAQMHFKYAYNLIGEIDTSGPYKSMSNREISKKNWLRDRTSIPISVTSLRSMLEAFELQNRMLHTAKAE